MRTTVSRVDVNRLVPPLDGQLDDGTISLRLRRRTDLSAIAEASKDPATRQWLDDEPLTEDELANSMRRVADAWQSGASAPLVIADTVTDDPLGLINLRFLPSEIAAVAYSVFPTARGRGIAARAVRIITRWAFGSLGVRTVVLEADIRNVSSIRVAEKTGFHRCPDRLDDRNPDNPRRLAVFELHRPGVHPE